jgi:hypothetical protein
VYTAYGVHVPSCPGTAQDWHVPLQAVLQQTRSTQLPEAHSTEALQAVPGVFFATQVPPEHQPVDLQSELAVQPEAHALLPLQKNWPHSPPGSVFTPSAVQVPDAPGRLQASHVPLHGLLQHTPSTQVKPERQSAWVPQVVRQLPAPSQ